MTSKAELFTTGLHYNFETLAPAILGLRYENVLCEGEISYHLAITLGFNVQEQYRMIYPALPKGTIDDPKHLRYYIFKGASHSQVLMCEQWINTSTIQTTDYLNCRIDIEKVQASDLQRLRDILAGSGYDKFHISIL